MGKGVLSAENHLSFFCIIGKITLRRRGKYCQREPAAEDTIPAGPGSQPWQPIIWAISLFICVLYSFWIIFEISFRLFSPQKVMNAAMMNCCWTKSLYFSVSFSINPMAFKYSVCLMEEDDGLSCFRYSISERILSTSVFIWFRLYQLINVNDRSRNNINNNNSIILLYFWSELFSVWLFRIHVHGPFLLFNLFVES